MDPERWKRIDEIFHAVLQRGPSERAEFLIQACEGDDVLRSEIEGLVESHEKEYSLFENPAADLAAEVLAKQRIHHTNIAHYRILKKIGSGGMGEVYLAEDSRLNRNVAIKVLPMEFSKDKEKIRRFEREARALSALNHPYILTVHDIGQIDSSIFIASEYIEGETLRNRMRSGRIPLKEVLTIIIQVAEALDAAHQVGIIHRDIKPENIMLRRDGYVKVLDFGLSKSIEDEPLTEASTFKTLTQTEKGMILGTVRYMSPEQARGLKLDARSDLFSLGIVFYEMIAGRVPFEGATGSDVLAAILEKNPASLRTYGDFPEQLQWVLSKLIEKDAEERYQSAKDLLTDLKRIRRQLDIEEELKRSESSKVVRTTVGKAKKKTLLVVPLLLMLLGAIGYFIFRGDQTSKSRKIPFQKTKLVRLTSSGRVWAGAISPDGKYIAYTQHTEESDGLYIRQLAADSEIKILTFPATTIPYESPRFSPAGEYVYYLAWSREKELGAMYRIPVLGGSPRTLVEGVDTTPAFSPDGKKMAFIRDKNKESILMIADVDGKSERKIASCKDPQSYGLLDWSPDGKTIASILRTRSVSGTILQIVGIDLDGSQRFLSDQKWIHEWGQAYLTWFPDGNGLVISKPTVAGHQIYYMSYPQGKITSITNDPNDYRGISVTKDGKSLVTKKHAYSATIWTAPATKPESIEQVSWGTDVDDGSTGLSWKPDGKILFHSNAPSGEMQLWFMNSNGSDRIRITTGGGEKFWPIASPDGRYIVYNELDGESLRLWRVDSNGDNPKLLSGKRSIRFPKISPDSKWILCSSMEKSKQHLIKIPIDGSKETILASQEFIIGQAISPDGNQIAYVEEDSKTSKIFMNILSSEGGIPKKKIPLEDDVLTGGRFQWTPDGSGVAYIRNQKGVSNIYVTPIDGSPGRYLTNFTNGSIHNFAWSFDGKHIAYSRVVRTLDIVLLQEIP